MPAGGAWRGGASGVPFPRPKPPTLTSDPPFTRCYSSPLLIQLRVPFAQGNENPALAHHNRDPLLLLPPHHKLSPYPPHHHTHTNLSWALSAALSRSRRSHSRASRLADLVGSRTGGRISMRKGGGCEGGQGKCWHKNDPQFECGLWSGATNDPQTLLRTCPPACPHSSATRPAAP